MVYFNGNCVRSLSCPEWQNDCYEIHLVKDDANIFCYVSSINSQMYLFRLLCSEIRRCCAPVVKFDEYTLWYLHMVFLFFVKNCFLFLPSNSCTKPCLSMFIKYIELKLVSEATCYVWSSHFFWLAEFLSLVLAPAMKVLLYHELGMKCVLIMLLCLCAVRSVRKFRWDHLFSSIHNH